MEDHRIVELYLQRNEQAIIETERKYSHYCHSIASRILGSDRDAEEIADHNGEWTSIKTALTTGIFLTVIMIICALIRETLGNATIWGKEIAFLANYKVSALAGAFGAYLVLACVLAAIKKLTGAHEHLEEEENE